MHRTIILLLVLLFGTAIENIQAQKNTERADSISSSELKDISFRSVGPAMASGRIGDLAINEKIPGEYYVAVASGGVWKTSNWGNTYTPIFDDQGSYSIGCITIDPNNPHTVWVGTGENNNQRSVAYGDGVYKSTDGGKSWMNMGLKESEHIGMIVVHPEDPNTVYVAAYGPLWSAGGERGLYKTTDGGENWDRILFVDKYTGINEVHMDPRDPDVLYATAHQRMRKVWTYLGGGPGSGMWKSTDGGENWFEINKGLPAKKMGRIGMDISPVNPDVLYAIVEAQDDKSGFYRSTDRGASWHKRGDYSTSGNYYQEIFCDPFDVDKVFAMDTWLHHTDDGGKSFQLTGEKEKHVDNHAMWIDPQNPQHWLLGSDGGIYETWDAAENWHYKPNLPITQYYKVAVDNEKPFYYIYGGTQDNNSMGGPSQTKNNAGIVNSDWFMTNGGDGFESQIDPEDPNTIYAQSQYGWLVRYNKETGERVGIKPHIKEGEAALRWNWDAPLLISPHENERLYFCANRVFKSENRGNSWEAISPDLSRQIDRNQLPIMGRVWGPDAVMKNKSTTMYGNIVAFDESPLQEGLLYAGTDDGLIQVKEPGSENWKKLSSFPVVPDTTYVNMLVASQHDTNTVYAVFNNHKRGDFKPYILKSTDRGQSWTAIHQGLPERGSTYALAEDHVDPELLFVGTEFGVHYTRDGGENWIALKNGLPVIAVRDLAIQKEENDLVLGTFGRSFYVLDDYSPLRSFDAGFKEEDAAIFPISDALLYVQTNPLGGRGNSHQGAGYYAAPNPPHGAIFTYYMKEKPKTFKEARQDREAPLDKEYKDVRYPPIDSLRLEDLEDKPFLLFIIKDENGRTVRKIMDSPSSGVNQLVWNMRYTTTSPIELKVDEPGRYGSYDEGPFAMPGKYMVSMYLKHRDSLQMLAGPEPFTLKTLEGRTLDADEIRATYDFYDKVAVLRRSIKGASELMNETEKRLKYIERAIYVFPKAPLSLQDSINALEDELYALHLIMHGDRTRAKREIETEPTLMGRIERIVYNNWNNLSSTTESAKTYYQIAKDNYDPFIERLRKVIKGVDELEEILDANNVPYTPGRGVEWQED